MTTSTALHKVSLTINGKKYDAEVPARRTLVDMLRYDLGLTGTKEACSVGVCGACTVLLNGSIVASCLTLAVQADGAEITTIEGIADGDKLHPLQESFMNNGGFQCGICTPGQIVASKALLDSNPHPTEDEIKEWMMGNLCRCTGYYQIIESIQKAAEAGGK
jgi:carbon-monoxide dehydrogenase small subunit